MLELEYLVNQISAFSGHQVKSAFQRGVCDTLPPKAALLMDTSWVLHAVLLKQETNENVDRTRVTSSMNSF